jgi:uncharacterized membrane protein YoaK (UPF0700 family)
MSQAVPPAVPVLLSFVAGYIDSCTFLALFGLFVAQVTGSFVFAGLQLVTPNRFAVVNVVAIPAFFLGGVATTVMVRTAERHGRQALPAALALEGLLLTGLLVAWRVGSPLRGPNTLADLCASLLGLSAMGVQSALVRLLLEGAPSTNVMTTNTTQLAIDATEFMLAWWPRHAAPADATAIAEYAALKQKLSRLWPVMLGFFLGTLAGAIAYAWFDLWCVGLAIAIVAGLAGWATALSRQGISRS